MLGSKAGTPLVASSLIRGYPLWDPQPTLSAPLHYRVRGVSIGDVGFFSLNGGFEFFSIVALSPIILSTVTVPLILFDY